MILPQDFQTMVLTPAHREAGFYLEEPDDHLLLLKQGNKTLATFSQGGTTVEAIRAEAHRHLTKPT